MELNGLYITVDTEPCCPVESCTVLYRAVQRYAELHRTEHYPAVLYSAAQFLTALCGTVQNCAVL